MFEWLITNLATIIVAAAVAVIVILILLKMRKDKKQGKHSCSGNCAGCTLCHHSTDGCGDGSEAKN